MYGSIYLSTPRRQPSLVEQRHVPLQKRIPTSFADANPCHFPCCLVGDDRVSPIEDANLARHGILQQRGWVGGIAHSSQQSFCLLFLSDWRCLCYGYRKQPSKALLCPELCSALNLRKALQIRHSATFQPLPHEEIVIEGLESATPLSPAHVPFI